MISPETQVALTNLAAIARGRVLVIGFGPELPTALDDPVVFHQDLRAHRASPGSTFGSWYSSDERFDAVVVQLPKATGRLRLLLAMARGVMKPGSTLTVVGQNDMGIRSVGPHVREAIGSPEIIDYRHHCRVITASLSHEAAPSSLAEWRAEFDFDGRAIVSYPGVFAHGRVDNATRLLLSALDLPTGARALDVGCGAGVIGAWLRARGISVDCVDVDALAVAATSETLARAGDSPARAFASDLYSDVTERYTHIVTNAPFHSGIRQTLGIGVPLVREAPEHLARGGELWLVANRFLDYMPHLTETFASVDVAAEDPRFRVYCAR